MLREILNAFQPVFGDIAVHRTDHHTPQTTSILELTSTPAEWTAAARSAAEYLLTSMMKEGATDPINNGPALSRILRDPAAAPVHIMTGIISTAVKQHAALSVGFREPEVLFPFVNGDEGFTAWAFASFIVQAEYIGTVVEDIAASQYAPSGRMQLTITPDGGFLLAWMDKQQEKIHQLKL
ncbi:MAG: hypothetical protein HUU02_02185 [Bacteroidetes bacterium]|nr:hypothetical protein [Bacteroidota bacterium]